MFRSIPAFALVAAGFALSGSALGATINVPTDFPTIQAAIDAPGTVNGDEIVVAPGVYSGLVDYGAKNLIVRSSGGPEVTTLNGLGQGTVVTIDMGQDEDAKLDGFTITGGTGTQFGVRSGGGGVVAFTADPVISNCIFLGNTADDGAAVYCFAANPKLVNCVAIFNQADGFQGKGGFLYCDLASPLVLNCTITNNSALNNGFGGGIYTVEGAPRLINTINYGNMPDAFGGGLGPIATYSNISGGFAGDGNIDADPMFTSAGTGDLSLLPGSPCIDRGDSLAIASDFFRDVAGNPRGVDDPDELDRGVATFGLTVDIGAHERQVEGSCQPDPCPLDVDDSGVIDFGDVLEIIINWGPCPS